VSLNSPCNGIFLSVIVHQKEELNFFDVLVSDRKHIFFNKNLTTQNRDVEHSKTILYHACTVCLSTGRKYIFNVVWSVLCRAL